MTVNRRFLLTARPKGVPKPADFAFVSEPLPDLAEGEILVRNAYASIDPAIRGWMDDAPSYMPPIPLGAPVRATTIGRVAASRHPDFAVGDPVMGVNGLEDYSVATAGGFTSKIDLSAVPEPTNFLSVYGAVGLTGYFGLLEVGQPKPGETVLVSGAAGAVGSVVGQIARIKGCRAVGIAGGAAKCQRLIDEFGFDAAIDYRGKDLAAMTAAIAEACPGGVDVFFDNVGGLILDATLPNINHRARLALCGMISQYNATGPVPGPTNLWFLIARVARMEGLLVSEYIDRWSEGAAEMARWIAEGKLVFREQIEEGLENALPVFLKLFEGTNDGKLILKISDL
ncbi:NADP-dependent oxidoreductase [Parapedomonas caeni]